MSDLNQTDLDVRLQLTGCKFGDLANTFANDLKFGRKCAVTNQRNLLLLNAFIELAECYCVETLATGTIEVLSVEIGSTIDLYIGGVLIISGVSPSFNEVTVMSGFATQINNLEGAYTAVYNDSKGSNGIIEITGTCENEPMTVVLGGPLPEVEVTGLTGGCCADRNCITEEELQTMMDNISKLTKICFQPIGFEYTPNT